MKNIILLGFMGTGKSSVGRLLARRTKRQYVDLDSYLEDKEKRKIREIFEKEGEPYFRTIEKEAVRFWAGADNHVITTGGGTVLDPENLTLLKSNGILVTLAAKPETIYERVKNSKRRPLLSAKENLFTEIQALMEKRKPLYQQADYYFDTDGKSASQVADLIQKMLVSRT